MDATTTRRRARLLVQQYYRNIDLGRTGHYQSYRERTARSTTGCTWRSLFVPTRAHGVAWGWVAAACDPEPELGRRPYGGGPPASGARLIRTPRARSLAFARGPFPATTSSWGRSKTPHDS